MKLMINGTWRGEIEATPELKAERMIHAGRFRGGRRPIHRASTVGQPRRLGIWRWSHVNA